MRSSLQESCHNYPIRVYEQFSASLSISFFIIVKLTFRIFPGWDVDHQWPPAPVMAGINMGHGKPPHSESGAVMENLLNTIESMVINGVPKETRYQISGILKEYKHMFFESLHAAQHEGAFLMNFAKHLRNNGIPVDTPTN